MVKRDPLLRLGRKLAIEALILLVAIPAFMTTLGASTASAEASGPPRLMSVEFMENEGRGQAIIEVSHPVTYTSHWVSDPDRLIVDIDRCILGTRIKPVPVHDGIVKQVRVAQFSPSVVRVVFDLERSAACSITRVGEDGRKILVRFNRRLEKVAFENVSGRQRLVIEATGNIEYKTLVLSGPDRIVLDFPETTVTSSIAEIPVDNGLVRRIRIGQNSPGVARVVIDLDKKTRFRVYTPDADEGKVIVDFGFRLAGISVDSHQDLTEVNIRAGGATPSKVEQFTGPERIVMRFDDTVVDMHPQGLIVGDGVIDRIEVSQEEPMASVVTFYLPYYLKHVEKPGKQPGDIAVEFTRSFCWQKTIVIDPGHGGQDPGAVGFTGLQEKDVALDISLRLAELLKAAGAKPVLTRSSAEYVFLPDRARIANS
ncbi:MAG TPA: N-acetylmuramoyl-L-alanine amidase, partial [Firmicutes bacterium]|nr:N-acetylmuramoyl-L-alanine amidase [Bacillota bacterium]